jgi:uncharacterized protein
MIEIGKIQKLRVSEEDKSGYYLLNDENQEIFMPGSLTTKEYEVGTEIDVFVWVDKDGNELATPKLPKYEVGDLALLEVSDIGPNGIFLDMGIPKDLIVPKRFQQGSYNKGELSLVKILLDGDNRIYGTSKLDKHFSDASKSLKKKQVVDMIPYRKTQLGYKVLIDSKFGGLIYQNEIFEHVEIGKIYKGSIKSIREDGLVDALLKKVGKEGVADDVEKIKKYLQNNAGIISLTDKSSPEEIKIKLNMSKKAFKKAVGILYKARIIVLNDTSIELTLR